MKREKSMEMEEMQGKIYIQMFEHLKVEGLGGALDENSIRSDMLNKLLAYLLCHPKEISAQELIDVLWYDEESDNPAGALKNLVYRLRTMLKKEWPDVEFIITGRGSYKWNTNIPFVTDVGMFEKYCEQASKENDREKKIDSYMQAIVVYKGMFLTKLMSEHWVASLSTYYHSLYLTAVKALVRLLEETERYEEMEHVCKNALCLDNLDEDLHCCFIRSLLQQKK